ncbi:MAG: IS110 family transposase, partial [Desulforhopalus sp.]
TARYNDSKTRRKVMGNNLRTKYVGMDVHLKSISIAIANDCPDGEVRLYGTTKNTVEVIDKEIRKLVSTVARLHFVYEAGPCGFGLYRQLTGNGFCCIVAAPSMIPKKSGVRIKNDNRDAIALARLLRAGELTTIYVPDKEDEAMRALTRARNDARIAARKAKQLLQSFLLHNDFIYNGKKKWTKSHYNWLAKSKGVNLKFLLPYSLNFVTQFTPSPESCAYPWGVSYSSIVLHFGYLKSVIPVSNPQ